MPQPRKSEQFEQPTDSTVDTGLLSAFAAAFDLASVRLEQLPKTDSDFEGGYTRMLAEVEAIRDMMQIIVSHQIVSIEAFGEVYIHRDPEPNLRSIEQSSEKIVGAVGAILGEARRLQFRVMGQHISAWYRAAPKAQGDGGSLVVKRENVKFINDKLRGIDAALMGMENSPCTLSVLPSKDNLGRYCLLDRATHRKKGFYETLDGLLPFKLMEDVPRRESSGRPVGSKSTKKKPKT